MGDAGGEVMENLPSSYDVWRMRPPDDGPEREVEEHWVKCYMHWPNPHREDWLIDELGPYLSEKEANEAREKWLAECDPDEGITFRADVL